MPLSLLSCLSEAAGFSLLFSLFLPLDAAAADAIITTLILAR